MKGLVKVLDVLGEKISDTEWRAEFAGKGKTEIAKKYEEALLEIDRLEIEADLQDVRIKELEQVIKTYEVVAQLHGEPVTPDSGTSKPSV